MKNRILITGVGSAIGYGHVKSLRDTKKYFLVGADCNAESIGFLWCDEKYLLPKVSDTNYFTVLEKICATEKIDFILIGSTVELPFFAVKKSEIEKKLNVQIICNTAETISNANDKFETQIFLQKNNFNFIRSEINFENTSLEKYLSGVSFPLFAKPRFGKGSAGIRKINSRSEIVKEELNDFVLQEFIPDDDGEFTVGILIGRNKEILSCIILKRELKFGMTFRAERMENELIKNYCLAVAQALPSFGPLNFQLRIKNGQPYIFEINPRFSSSSFMRTILGVNEPHIFLHYLNTGEILPQTISEYKIVVRGFDDFVLTDEHLKFKTP